MREQSTISLLSSLLHRSPAQLNVPFESDAEFVRLAGATYGFTIDEHSPTEDRFTSFDPETLGWNLVVCTVSDLLAAGVQPAFYLHSITLPNTSDAEFCMPLFRGIEAALQAEGCALLGGDTSFAADWRYVGVAMGPTERGIFRTELVPGDVLFATGPFGSGNRQALLSVLLEQGRIADTPDQRRNATVRFACRRHEAEQAWRHVRAGIDSSDGLCGALLDLKRANPDCGLLVEPRAELLDPVSVATLREFGLPEALLLFGPAGEYELLFAVPGRQVDAFLGALSGVGASPLCVGEVIAQPGLWFRSQHGNVPFDETSLPDPRLLQPGDYLRELTQTVATFWRLVIGETT